jgi:hypothetical protein
MTRALFLITFLLLSGFATRAQTATDIRRVDFGNFTFRIGNPPITMEEGIQVGACAKRRGKEPTGDVWNVVPENIAYGDLDGDGREEAVVPIFANACGGTMITGERVLVYTLRGGRPTILPGFDYIDEGCEKGKECDFTRSPIPLVEYDAEEKAIVIQNRYQTEEDATCCPSRYRRTWYRWDGSRFRPYKKSEIMKREEGD